MLLHQEVAIPAAGRSTGGGTLAGQTAADRAASLASTRSGSISSILPAPLGSGSFLTPPAGPLAPAAVKLAGVMASPAAAAWGAAAMAARQQQQQLSPGPGGDLTAAAAAMRVSGSQILLGAAAAAEAAGTITAEHNAAGDLITAPVDVRPGAAVVPFWEPVELEALGIARASSGGGVGNGNGSSPGQPAGSNNAAEAPNGNGSKAGVSSSGGKVALGTCLEIAKALQVIGGGEEGVSNT